MTKPVENDRGRQREELTTGRERESETGRQREREREGVGGENGRERNKHIERQQDSRDSRVSAD